MARKITTVTTTYSGVNSSFLDTLTSYFGVRKKAGHSGAGTGKPVGRPISDGVVPTLNARSTTYLGVRNHVLPGKYRVLGGKKPRTSGKGTTYSGVKKRVLGGKEPRTRGLVLCEKPLQNVGFSKPINRHLVNCSVFVYVVLLTTRLTVSNMRSYQGRSYG